MCEPHIQPAHTIVIVMIIRVHKTWNTYTYSIFLFFSSIFIQSLDFFLPFRCIVWHGRQGTSSSLYFFFQKTKPTDYYDYSFYYSIALLLLIYFFFSITPLKWYMCMWICVFHFCWKTFSTFIFIIYSQT